MPKSLLVFPLAILALSAGPSSAASHLTIQPSRPDQPPQVLELDSGWQCMNVRRVTTSGEKLSQPSFPLTDWLSATVPGTVLTTLLNNKRVPDPFFGMNNASIPDIADSGRDYYTYWFVNDFPEHAPVGKTQVWLSLRGVNYGCDVYLNGHRLNPWTHYGMYLRQRYNITSFLSKDGKNRLAVLVFPPDPVGDPNGGQGGDGTIGRNVSSQFVAGWDWIQPIRDRNTGIWDRVTIEETTSILLCNPHIVTLVPGVRYPEGPQAPARIKASTEIDNPTDESVRGTVRFTLDNRDVSKEVEIPRRSSVEVNLPEFEIEHPHLWWPNGYGPQSLSRAGIRFEGPGNSVLDQKNLTVGIREIETRWNSTTKSREVYVNGQPIFIRGGNWIASDAMLRLSADRYDAEVRFQRDMNLNLLRVWGGGLTERPEFYDACDRYGLLVFQDFWISGDCNGKWLDPKKKDDQWTRRRYPDDHALFLASVADQVRMLRNHPSLAFYCGGNETPPPEDILNTMQDSLLPALDATRYFFTYSNADSMSHNSAGGNGDGTYHLQPAEYFWEHRSFPFNSEVGSVGLGDYESLERFIPPQDLVIPHDDGGRPDSVWSYHRDLPYGNRIDAYGTPSTLRDFADKAQFINYDQYRALIEGHLSHMWDWYTGVIIWKTQNPWTALRGQMYDYYLDPNAALYGLHHAGEPLHVMCNPADGMVSIVNNTFRPYHDLMVQARAISIEGKDSLLLQWIVEIGPSTFQKINTVRKALTPLVAARGGFLELRLIASSRQTLSDNLYWLPDSVENFTGLNQMKDADIRAVIRKSKVDELTVSIANPAGGPLAFFNRISLVDRATKKRILPVFYSDNYISVLPGEERSITLDYPSGLKSADVEVSIKGWNVKERFLGIP